MRMTVEERDQWECLLADWSALYDFSVSDQEGDEEPFKAVPHADPNWRMKAPRPRLLRAAVREDHARRTAAAAPQKTR